MKRYFAYAFIVSILSLSVFSGSKEDVTLQSLFDSYQNTLPPPITVEKETSSYTLKDALKSYSDSFQPAKVEDEYIPSYVSNDYSEGYEVVEDLETAVSDIVNTIAAASVTEDTIIIESSKETPKAIEENNMDKEREELPYYSQDLSYGSYKAKVAVYSDHALIRIDSTLGKDFSRLLSNLFAYYLDITGVSYTLEENLVTIRYPKLSENILAYIVKYLDAYTYSSFDTNSEAINPAPDNSEPQEAEINEEIEIASQKEVSSAENELIVASESDDMPLFVNNYTILNSEAKLTVYSDHALFWTDLSFSQGDVKNLANTFSALYPVLKNVKYTLTEDTVTLYYPEQSESFLRSAVSVAEKDVNYYLNAILASETAKTGNQVAVTEARLPEVKEVVKPIIEPAPISPVKPVETIATADKKETFSINKLSALTMLSINSEFISFKVGARYDFTEKIAARLNIYNGFDVQVLYDSKLISNETLSIYGGLGLGYSALRKWNAQLFVGVQKTFNHIAAAAEFGFINSKPQASLILSYQF